MQDIVLPDGDQPLDLDEDIDSVDKGGSEDTAE
jgi:hypothetical protein